MISMLIPDEPYLGFAALCHIAGAFCLIPALLHTRTPQGTIAWLISLLAFPYIAVPFYLILGRRTFSGYVETRRRQTDSESPWGELTDKITNCMKPYAIRTADTAGEIMQTLGDIVRLPVCRGNSCHLLIDADNAFPRIYDAIKKAERYILIEFFIIKNDSVGQNLKKLLIERARDGINIYMLYDEIGSHKLPPGYISALRKEGVNIEPFNGKRHFLSNVLRLNFRNHRKLVVVDGSTAFIGGMNIGRDMVGTMTNTLILAFLGSGFTLILYLYSLGLSPRQLLSSAYVSLEVVSGVASSVGVILSIPLTALITAEVFTREKKSGKSA